MKKLLMFMIIAVVFASCSNYYKAVTVSQPSNAASINGLSSAKRYFILRNGSEAFGMTGISISADEKTLQCNLEILPFEHRAYFNDGVSGKKKYRNDDDGLTVLNEVHFYITPESNLLAGPYSLPLDKVTKTEVIEKDISKTKKSHRMGVVIGVSSAVVVVGGAAALLISSSLSNWGN